MLDRSIRVEKYAIRYQYPPKMSTAVLGLLGGQVRPGQQGTKSGRKEGREQERRKERKKKRKRGTEEGRQE